MPKFCSWHVVFLEVAHFQPYDVFLLVNTLYLSQKNSLCLNQKIYRPETSASGKIYIFSSNVPLLWGYVQFFSGK